MNNNSFSHDSNTQFALSYELLYLLKWLAHYDTDKLKKIISKAVTQGLHDEIQKTSYLNNSSLLEEMHHSIVDFFEVLDSMLVESIREHVQHKAKQKNLLSTIDHFDTSILDSETVHSSIENTTKKLDSHPNINAKEQLYKELLKNWKPIDKQIN